MKVALAGRAAEQIVFGRVTNGAANDLEKVSSIARRMVFDLGMGERIVSHTLRADDYPLSEQSKQLRDEEQSRITDTAYGESMRLLEKHRASLDRVALELLDKETISREEMQDMLADVGAESRSSETIGVVRAIPEPAAADESAG
jgi:cell division protease FtsH